MSDKSNNLITIFLTLVALLMLSVTTYGAQSDNRRDYFVRGIVKDSITDEPIAQAIVSINGKNLGTLTDNQGIFEMTLPQSTVRLTVSSQGYQRKTLTIHKNRVNLYAVYLSPEAVALNEVVIKKQRYSKKNNPAVDFMQRIRKTADVNDPMRNDYYNYDKYERINIALNHFAEKEENSWMFRKFPFLWEHVDTSEVSGNPILNVSVKETSSELHFRRQPKMSREIVKGIKRDGIDEITDQESVQTFLEDVLREINLYDRDINILQNRFVSPLSPIAADFYKFYLGDTVYVDSTRCVTLSFYPHNKAAFGFIGQMYVEPSDTAMFIKKVTMKVADDINLNFIDKLYVNQGFKRANDGSRLKVRDDMTLEIKVLPGTSGLYVRRNVAYANHNFIKPEDSDDIFKGLAQKITQRHAYDRDTIFWNGVRLIPMASGESHIQQMMRRLRSVKLYYWGEKVVKAMASGYVATSSRSKFDVGPLNTMISANTLEGLRLRVGGMTTAYLSPNFFSRFYVARGFRDDKWKYELELEYSFKDKKYHSREFPIHSVKLNSLYDIDQIGQHYEFTSQDNIFLALKRMSDNNVSYHRLNTLTYQLELENHFSVKAAVANERQYASRLLKFNIDGVEIPHFDETWLDVQLRYAPGEKFYQTRSYRFPVNLDAPVLVLSHRVAPKNWFGSKYFVNRTEFSIQKRFWFSAFGYTDIIAKTGHVWSRSTPYTQLFIPNANLSYTIQPESFSMMNTMEFVTDTYASWDVTYWANGALLNYVPLVKKLKLREVFSFRGVWGRLSHHNDPAYNSSLLTFPEDANRVDISKTPYMEVGVGIENIFKCLRLDYVWRVTHRDPGYKIDRSGLRLALHITF
jgi:hypothetical protein